LAAQFVPKRKLWLGDIYLRVRLDVCIGMLGIAFNGISISRDICIEINANIFVWMFRYWELRIDILVEYQIPFGWSIAFELIS
jgi:hypothetical protein